MSVCPVCLWGLSVCPVCLSLCLSTPADKTDRPMLPSYLPAASVFCLTLAQMPLRCRNLLIGWTVLLWLTLLANPRNKCRFKRQVNASIYIYIIYYTYTHTTTYVLYIYTLEFDLSLYRDRICRNLQVKVQCSTVDMTSKFQHSVGISVCWTSS